MKYIFIYNIYEIYINIFYIIYITYMGTYIKSYIVWEGLGGKPRRECCHFILQSLKLKINFKKY